MMGWWMNALVPQIDAVQIEQVQWFWSRPGFAWAALFLCLPLMWWIHHRHRRGMTQVSALARHVLTACRTLVVVLLLLVLAGPFVRLTYEQVDRPVLAVIVDRSQSMDVSAGPFEDDEIASMAYAAGLIDALPPSNDEADADAQTPAAVEQPALSEQLRQQLDGMTRAELVRAILATHGRRLVDFCRERFDLRIYSMAGEVVREAETIDSLRVAAAANGHATPLGEAIEKVLADAAGRKLAGIVLISDGRNTAGVDPQQVVSSSTFAATDAPLLVLAPGSRRPLADVAITQVVAPQRIGRGDHLNVMAVVESHGLAGRDVTVSLMRGSDTLDTAPLTLRDNQQQQVALTFEASQEGAQALQVVVDVQPEERIAENNRHTFPVEVDAAPVKVLLIEGYPRWDFRFIDHMLRRDEGVEVTLIMESALRGANESGEFNLPDDLPRDVAGFAAYDLVMLGDISPEMLPRAVQEQLVQAISEEGVGLIVQAGFQHMPHAFVAGDDAPLISALPLTMSASPGRDAPAHAPFTMLVTASGALHPAFQVHRDVERNRSMWSAMPAFYWSAAPVRPRPGATVLAETESARQRVALMAEHLHGRGRVLFIGTDSTFLWRRNVGNALFDRFWSQAMRHVARRRDRALDRSWLAVRPGQVDLGEQALVEAYLVDAAGAPLEAAEVSVDVHGDGRAGMITLRPTFAPGHYRALWRPSETGRVELRCTDGSGSVVAADVEVVPSLRERVRPDIDFDGLRGLTTATGGAMLDPAELCEVPTRLEGASAPRRRVIERDAWDNWVVLVLVTGLYCLDVGLRRYLGAR